ncbi:hypothetical protein BP00DRAFT_423531 [Aspergillus indologenus CBS 114.80]|uniref:Uncharacterized protein n=1 Tax=Aspergillus indologenus CBS 114.80 TaxID=1450541 RepID=A0A2V5ID06_9EURO|nr:hypothetical protein BP00DRAFT_423531 [Aspergillus indologenus CBS 114.80]
MPCDQQHVKISDQSLRPAAGFTLWPVVLYAFSKNLQSRKKSAGADWTGKCKPRGKNGQQTMDKT